MLRSPSTTEGLVVSLTSSALHTATAGAHSLEAGTTAAPGVNLTKLMDGHGHGGNMTTAGRLVEDNPRLVNGVVVLLLMVLNIGGNSLVLYIYNSLSKRTVFCLFVKVLASLDLLTALTTMLVDVVMKLRANHETVLRTSAMCKLSHYQVYANSMLSGCVLTLIAYQRYRKICHPLERGMQLGRAKILLAIIACACLVLSIPTVFLYGPRHVRVLVRSTVVTATICRADEGLKDSSLHLIFYYLLIFSFCLVLGSTCVLYFMVSRAIRKFEIRNSLVFSSSPTTADAAASPGLDDTTDPNRRGDDDDDDGDDNNLDRRGQPLPGHTSPLTDRTLATSPVHGRPVVNDPYRPRHPLATAAAASPHQHPSFSKCQVAKKREQFAKGRMSTFSMASNHNVISAQMYRVFSIITVVYIISYLPHLVALILTKVLELDDQVLTFVQRMALEFAYNCPYISTVSNPLIYGFSSSEFRDHVKECLQSWECCCCCYCCCDCYDCCDCCDCCDSEEGNGCCSYGDGYSTGKRRSAY